MNRAFNIATTSEESLTLYDLQRMVRGALESRFSNPVWISAEISELKLNNSGHCYLNLVEKGAGGGTPRAEARAMIWRSAYNNIATSFEQATGSPLCSGLKVLVRVVVNFHETYGYSLQIIDIDPSYTLGDVERRRRETIAMLIADGVWDMNRELSLARPTLRIAVVSSATAAGYRDFMRELQRGSYRFKTTLFESTMQGDGGEDSIICALEEIASREEEFDIVAIIRGGGSTSDLALFDSYRIASHVAQFPLPVVTGIGHDKDVSVADMVAHTHCKTPTAVATFFAELADVELNVLEEYASGIANEVESILQSEAMRVYTLSTDIERTATMHINDGLNHLSSIHQSLHSRLELIFSTENHRLDEFERTLKGYSIDNILQLGFAIVRSGDKAITATTNCRVGDSIDVELNDGVLSAEIKSITPTKH
ncbi:MAG: exodeoxyribonuclease VII large subunit [Alistipes sp.]|nr:exodeoxyribonuclease VII large subunit [Alistipes sp.]